jgi:hypothetical protein
VERRTSKDYNGVGLTSRRLSEMLPQALNHIGRHYSARPDLVIAAWPEVIGERLAPMAQAISFADGVLHVRVQNSTLYSLLVKHDKLRLLKNLRSRFPNMEIKNILFKIG